MFEYDRNLPQNKIGGKKFFVWKATLIKLFVCSIKKDLQTVTQLLVYSQLNCNIVSCVKNPVRSKIQNQN